MAFKPGVLYKDLGGKKGYCYYSRPEQNIRLFFKDYRVAALYVPLEEDGSGGDDAESVMQVTAVSEVKEYQDHPEFAGKIAADLLGVDGVRVYHDQALLKEAGGGLTPWHQDQHYWPLATDNTITMWMPLVDVTPEMGTMHFASGSHRNGYLGDLPISDESEAKFAQFIKERGYTKVPGAAMKAGDATFYYGWTLHGAPGNASTRTREVMTIIWYADGTRVGPLDNANRQRDRDRWLPGLQPDDLAASELNPLVFRC